MLNSAELCCSLQKNGIYISVLQRVAKIGLKSSKNVAYLEQFKKNRGLSAAGVGHASKSGSISNKADGGINFSRLFKGLKWTKLFFFEQIGERDWWETNPLVIGFIKR